MQAWRNTKAIIEKLLKIRGTVHMETTSPKLTPPQLHHSGEVNSCCFTVLYFLFRFAISPKLGLNLKFSTMCLDLVIYVHRGQVHNEHLLAG